MSKSVNEMVLDFHKKYEYPVADVPCIPEDDKKYFRLSLLTEEVLEVGEAVDKDDIVGIAHELADVVYVAYGTALTYGINLDDVIAEIHKSNMTKEKGVSGKGIKGDKFVPADVSKVLWR